MVRTPRHERDQIGKVGDIVSESPGDFTAVRLGDFIGIRSRGPVNLVAE